MNDKLWEFIGAVVKNTNQSLNDVLHTDFQSLLRVMSSGETKKKKQIDLFEFIGKESD